MIDRTYIEQAAKKFTQANPHPPEVCQLYSWTELQAFAIQIANEVRREDAKSTCPFCRDDDLLIDGWHSYQGKKYLCRARAIFASLISEEK